MTSNDKSGQIVFDAVNLIVSDMAASLDFYRLLGLDIPATEPDWEDHHRVADIGASVSPDIDLDSREFAATWSVEPGKDVPAGPVIGFRVRTRDAVDELYERVTAAGHVGRRAPYDTFWGARYAILEDPDGTAIGVMSPADAEHRVAMPSPSDFAT